MIGPATGRQGTSVEVAAVDRGLLVRDPAMMSAKLRLWHCIVIALLSGIALLLLWFGIAYDGLPRL